MTVIKAKNTERGSNQLNTPVLLLIFNRPDTVKQVFDQIKQVKPKHLFIAADGPRTSKPQDAQLCREARLVVDNIDWDCIVKKLYRDENLGSGIAVGEAITWFFEHVEQGIILEDDCFPHLTFFSFCETLLDYYKNDTEVIQISGSNFQFGKQFGEGSYYFSTYNHIWGWATWRRSWQYFDIKMSDYPDVIKTLDIEEYWKKIFADTYHNQPNDVWDYQWFYQTQKRQLKAVIPNKNLIHNIGFNRNATHTKNLPHWYKYYKLDSGGIVKIKHPTDKTINYAADRQIFEKIFKFTLIERGKRLIKRYLPFLKR